jgi:hypothetical protein
MATHHAPHEASAELVEVCCALDFSFVKMRVSPEGCLHPGPKCGGGEVRKGSIIRHFAIHTKPTFDADQGARRTAFEPYVVTPGRLSCFVSKPALVHVLHFGSQSGILHLPGLAVWLLFIHPGPPYVAAPYPSIGL